MGRVSMATRNELVAAVAERYARGADRDHQDVEQLVLDPPVAAWILDLGELVDQRLEHGFLLLARREAYPVSMPD